MRRFTLDHALWLAIGVLLLAFPPALYREADLVVEGRPGGLSAIDFGEPGVHELEVTWRKTVWQAPSLEIWVDDCLRSLVVDGTDLSRLAYCDFVGSRRIDLSPFLADGRATLELRVENLGGPGGLRLTGVPNAFVGTHRYVLVFVLLLLWAERRGRTGAPSSQAARAGLPAALVAVVGTLWLATSLGRGPAPDPAPPGDPPPPPSREEDERLNPRLLVAGAEFPMGSPEGVAYPDEEPLRRVRVSPFRMQRHEVTNEEYVRFRPDHGFTRGQERHPVVNVTWHEALAYAEWLGGSLPTEAQWELAARGPSGRTYPWGDAEPTCERANFNECGWRLRAVGGRPEGATPEGIEDLAGNAWEWCLDWYADRYPVPSAEGSEGAATDPRGPAAGSVQVFRGGSFISGPGHLRGAYRGHYLPGFLGHDIGFRVVWSVADP